MANSLDYGLRKSRSGGDECCFGCGTDGSILDLATVGGVLRDRYVAGFLSCRNLAGVLAYQSRDSVEVKPGMLGLFLFGLSNAGRASSFGMPTWLFFFLGRGESDSSVEFVVGGAGCLLRTSERQRWQ